MRIVTWPVTSSDVTMFTLPTSASRRSTLWMSASLEIEVDAATGVATFVLATPTCSGTSLRNAATSSPSMSVAASRATVSIPRPLSCDGGAGANIHTMRLPSRMAVAFEPPLRSTARVALAAVGGDAHTVHDRRFAAAADQARDLGRQVGTLDLHPRRAVLAGDDAELGALVEVDHHALAAVATLDADVLD